VCEEKDRECSLELLALALALTLFLPPAGSRFFALQKNVIPGGDPTAFFLPSGGITPELCSGVIPGGDPATTDQSQCA